MSATAGRPPELQAGSVPGRVPRRSIYTGFRQTLKTIGTGERGRRALTFQEARDAMEALLSGEATPAQAGAFLIAMRIKGESPEELAGMVLTLRERATVLQAGTERPVVACAAPFDGSVDAPALSLAAAVLAAACGAGVVVSCGSLLGPKYGTTVADVLAALGGPATPTARQAEAMMTEAGVSLVNASTLLDGWTDIAPVRDTLGLRGPIHSAEKLVDWFGARRFVVGYAHAAYAERLHGALRTLGATHTYCVRGPEGLDVARPGRPHVQFNGARLDMPEQPGDRLPDAPGPERAAALTEAVLAGHGEHVVTYTVVLAAAVRLHAAGLAPNVLRGVAKARAAIADGRAADTLARMLAAAGT